MAATDLDAALAAIATLESLSDEQQRALSSIEVIRRNGEPFVDVHELFALYDVLYFRKFLVPRVEVIWSPRLTLVRGLYFDQSLQPLRHSVSATVSARTPEAARVLPSRTAAVAPPISRLPCQTPANNAYHSAPESVSCPGIQHPRAGASPASASS